MNSASNQTRYSFHDILTTAENYFNDGNYERAEPLLNYLLKRTQKDPRIFHILGTIYYEKGRFNDAIKAFKKALQLDPNFTDSSLGLSVILNDLGKYKEASEVFLKAQKRLKKSSSRTHDTKKISDMFAEKHKDLGQTYLRYERPQKALLQFIAAEELVGLTQDLLILKVKCLKLLGKITQAIYTLESADSIGKHYTPKMELAKLYLINKEVTKAQKLAVEMLHLFPENKDVLKFYNNLQSLNHTTSRSYSL